jgi:hypothetical protein
MKISIAKIAAVVSFLGLVFVTPASADTHIRVGGNGYGSDNTVRADMNKDVTVFQSNDTDIRNDVSISNNTGHNSSSFNTGGDTTIRTGDAVSNVSIQNKAGFNAAHISGCGGCQDDLDINVHGNGAFSDNNVRVSSDDSARIVQTNNTNINNDIDVHNNTGYNRASGNTGSWKHNDGDVKIVTGDAIGNVSVKNEAGMNIAHISGHNDGDHHVKVHGNGAFSDNSVVLGGSDRYDHHDYEKHDYDKKDHEKKVYYGKDNGYDNHNKERYTKHQHYDDGHKKGHEESHFVKKHEDHDKKYVKDHEYDKKHEKKDHDYKDYDKDKKSYDHDKKHDDYHKNYHAPYITYVSHDYDKWDKKGKHYDHKDKYDHDKRYVYIPIHKKVNYVRDYDHGKKFKKLKSYDHYHGKYHLYPVKYVVVKDYDYKKKDHDHNKKHIKHVDKKHSDKKYVSYKPHYDKKDYVVKKNYKPYVKHVDYKKYDHKNQNHGKIVVKDKLTNLSMVAIMIKGQK